MAVRQPAGVVSAFGPFNVPYILCSRAFAVPVAYGNTAVLKPSEEAPVTGGILLAEIFEEAGLPPGVLNVITGRGADCGIALTSHPLISRIAFTGGPETARHIVRNSAANLAVTTLELGGKSPVVVFDDAGLESTASAIVAGIFAAAGCCGRSEI